MNNKQFFSLAILGTFLMILILFSQNQVVDADHQTQSSSLSDANQTALTQLISLLADSESSTARENLESKIQALEYKENIQASALLTPQKSLEEVCNSIKVEETNTSKNFQSDLAEGILEVQGDFLGEEGYLINTLWRGEFSGYEVEVYAGSLYQDEQKGLVIMNIPELSFFKVFYTPEPNGSLRISQVEEYRLQLSAANGSTHYFDIPAQQFTNDMAKSLSIADLPPAPTPIMNPCAQFRTP
ncbi:MAG: hypothetical protein Q7U53_11330 [Anaerolineaceae bacterium]|nr:hypothetical protein [Anaerolineaceae bacterium]